MISKQTNRTVGAEEVFPLVIYAILKGNVRKLKSNLSFIFHFRHSTRLESAEEYYYTTLTSAIEFIETIKNDKLNIKESDFINFFNQAEKKEANRFKIQYVLPKSKILLIKSLGNNDENVLLYNLSDKQSDSYQESVELLDYKNDILINTDSTVPKSYLNNSQALLNVDIDKINREYYNSDFNEMSLVKIEKMSNDFKIVLRLIESFRTSNNNVKSSSSPIKKVDLNANFVPNSNSSSANLIEF